jgi:TetR/AcrR family transcriptional repressor of nem operon
MISDIYIKLDEGACEKMRVSKAEMEKSHERIVANAARLVRKRGIEQTSVADVMHEAGLTHGGFYRHFKTKDELVRAAMESAFEEVIGVIETRFERDEPEAAILGFEEHYLSKGHVQHPEMGCPVAALGADVGREPGGAKKAFGEGVKRLIDALAKGMRGTKQERRQQAARELAMLAGAVIIARASDGETANAVLAACRRGNPSA